MLRVSAAALAAALGLGLCGQALAGTVTVFSNPSAGDGWGDCSFSTTCAARVGRGDDFAGEEFTLASAQSVNAASFDIVNFGQSATSANWAIYQADGAGGLPGTLVASGAGEALTATDVGNDIQQGFGLGTNLNLSSGSYYFAVQAVSPVFQTYLAHGVNGGAVETMDGGVTWSPGYEGINGVTVALYDVPGAVPEPATWAMLILGIGAIGLAARRRSAGSAAVA